MPFYESIFVVRPSLTDEDTQKIIEKMKGVVEKSGATVLKSENWGKKKLAYEVKRERTRDLEGTRSCNHTLS